MDITRIEPTMLQGEVKVPPSKSVAHRAMIAAALSDAPCRIGNIAMSKDIQATLECMKVLGASARFFPKKGEVCFSAKRKKKLPEELHLDCGESGSTLRFLMPLALLSGRRVTFTGHGRLMQRPQTPYMDLFTQKGILWEQKEDSITLQGELKAGLYQLAGNISSQFITGLLYTLPLLEGDSEIQLTTLLASKGYVDLTLQVLEDFGISVINDNYRRFIIPGGQKYLARDYEVEGDYSQAAFFLVAGALGCDLICTGLNPESLQGDKQILAILKDAGARVEILEQGGIKVRRTDRMKGVKIDGGEIPDLVPILAVLCGFCPGESLIYNAARLRMKESDRLAAITRELRQMGIDVFEGVDFLRIQGTAVAKGATVSSWNDHRIAMATAIAACRAEGEVTICGGKEAVTKSYPDFFEVYESLATGPRALLGAKDKIVEE